MGVRSKIFETFAQLLYSDKENGQDYYKVPVKIGEYMVGGKVAETCRAAGMDAVCPGPVGCHFTPSNCLVTRLSSECGHPMLVALSLTTIITSYLTFYLGDPLQRSFATQDLNISINSVMFLTDSSPASDKLKIRRETAEL